MSSSPLQVAIVGSGPAGFYTAEALAAKGDAVRVDILDRLPTPFGLVRGGVAPDHQTMKQVAKRYEKTAQKDGIRFIGHITVGEDIAIGELLELYDAVVLATGAYEDRKLNIPGESLPGVWGSGSFVGWYNSHPDYAHLDPELQVPAVAVIGNGNVAVDVARVLAKSPGEMAHSDLADYADAKIHAAPIRDIFMLGRRGPAEAKFTPKELGEMGELAHCVPLVDPGQLPAESVDQELESGGRKVMGLLRGFSQNSPEDKPVRLHFVFYANPVEFLGSDRLTGLRLERTRVENGRCITTGETFDIDCGLAVTCIGYRSVPIPEVPFDDKQGHYANEAGRIDERLYAVGWARRGPTGTIGTNKPDGAEIAERILGEVSPGNRPGGPGLDRLARERGLALVGYEDWKRIENAEIERAEGERPRLKFRRIADMLAAARAQG